MAETETEKRSKNINDWSDLKKIERSIIKTYRKYLWTKFYKAVVEYEMISEGDKVAVAISGGKDSLLLAKLLQELQRYHFEDLELVFIAMDPGFTKETREYLEKILDYLEIETEVFDTNVFDVSERLGKNNPCYLCARMRRGALYNKAEDLGANKLALGHHLDDVVETTLLNVMCGSQYKTMLPKHKARNFEGMELIRPMYLIEEKSIIAWMDNTGIEPLDCACTVTTKDKGSKRAEIKDLIASLEDDFEGLKMSIFRSAENVDVDSVIEYKKDDKRYNFLYDY